MIFKSLIQPYLYSSSLANLSWASPNPCTYDIPQPPMRAYSWLSPKCYHMVLLCYNPEVGREELPLFFPPPTIPLFPVYLGHRAMTRGSWLTGRFWGCYGLHAVFGESNIKWTNLVRVRNAPDVLIFVVKGLDKARSIKAAIITAEHENHALND